MSSNREECMRQKFSRPKVSAELTNQDEEARLRMI